MLEDFDKVTTKSGDYGVSSNWSGRRIDKSDEVFDVLGNIDELSTWIGTLIKKGTFDFYKEEGAKLTAIQNRLHDIMSQVATDPWEDPIQKSKFTDAYAKLNKLTYNHIEEDLEKYQLELLRVTHIENKFVLPGGNIHLARVVCRRAERSLVKFMRNDQSRFDLRLSSKYLNRLSDLLFILAVKYP